VEEQEVDVPELVDTNEEGTVIETVTTMPACQSGYNGGEVYFKVGTVPDEITVQVKEAGGEYEDAFTRGGLYEQYLKFAICYPCRGIGVDFKLDEGKVYVLRLKFDQTKVYNRTEYSNEHLIDTREDSEYMLKLC
jgi:hypothetical protein